jgi:hypothetical protein
VASPTFTNLSALIEKLEKLGKHGGLRKTLVQAWRAQSCLADLKQALDCYEVLQGILKRPRTSNTPEIMTTERALLITTSCCTPALLQQAVRKENAVRFS